MVSSAICGRTSRRRSLRQRPPSPSKNTTLAVAFADLADVAPVVVFLASGSARMVNGATYDVTAGDSANNVA